MRDSDVPTRAPAFGALDPQPIELADQVAEDDRAVAGNNCGLVHHTAGGLGLQTYHLTAKFSLACVSLVTLWQR